MPQSLPKQVAKKTFHLIFITVFCLIFILLYPNPSTSLEEASGEKLFKMHCSGCHVNGGNIIRRGKNLKLSALQRNGLDSPEAIAKVARDGFGSMSSYQKVLGEDGDVLVGTWVWEQAQKAWTHG